MNTFKRMIHYSSPYWWRIVLAAAGSSVVGGMDALFAYLSGPLVKQLFATKDWTILRFVPLGIIAIFTVRGLARYLNDYFIRTSGQLAIQDIRNELYRKNMELGLAYFNRNQTGALMSRVLNDVGLMQDGVANVVTGLFRDGLGAVFLLGVIFYLNWKLAIIAFLVLPATIYPAQKIGRRIKTAVRRSQEKIGDLAAILQESYAGIKVIKAFNMAERENERFAEANRGFYHFLRKSIKYEGVAVPVMEFLSSLGVAAVVWASIAMIRRGTLTPEALLSFVAAMILLYNPIKKLSGTYNTLQRATAAAERIFESMDEKPEIVDSPSPLPIGKAEGDVELANVSFRYGEENVLNDVSLRAGRGEVVALVGPSGGGKSTLVSLIPRFYDVTAGTVLIDGTDVRQLRLADLMRQIALVDQETVLFNETIANNIRYGKPDASDAEVENAALAAFAHDFIMEMPDGYRTNIGDRGVRLSGGQRQRLCIARAILKDAPILILDEATSALDTESEQMVQRALNNLMANRTTFVIAHRLSTILHADKIAVIDQGRVVEEGSHEELLVRGGLYKKLYDMQFQG
ncbi:MAG TPA: lipid A export permease/ATP-binding protein MsbA [Geobacteraceae bacterium]|nr:lipid A export permease/ATP-binding protein MsbA [Geobacteraceae bacterium]